MLRAASKREGNEGSQLRGKTYNVLRGQSVGSVVMITVTSITYGDVTSVPLDDVNELIHGGVATAEYVGAGDTVLSTNGQDQLLRKHRLRHHGLKVDGALVLAPAMMCRRMCKTGQ